MPLQSTVEECGGGQGEEETDIEELYDDGPEIVEQSELDHFNTILQKAQRIAAEAGKSQKRPKKYNGKSERTLKRHKRYQEELAKQGYLPVFEFIACSKEKARKREHMEQLVARARVTEIEQESKESASEEVDTKDLMSECAGQVRHRNLLMHQN